MSIFHHGCYEIVPGGEVYRGKRQVEQHFTTMRTAFQEQRNELA